MALIEGVDLDNEFGDYLAGKPPPTRELFNEKANVRLWWEEAKANRKRKSEGASKEGVQSNIAVKQSGDSSGKVEVNVGNQSGGNSNRNGNGNRRNRNQGNSSNKRPKFQTFENYTPLNDTLENIYLDTYSILQYKKPPPRDSTEKEIATGKFCLFHGTHGHSTNECRHLRDIVQNCCEKES